LVMDLYFGKEEVGTARTLTFTRNLESDEATLGIRSTLT
jgi:hypothetical protein